MFKYIKQLNTILIKNAILFCSKKNNILNIQHWLHVVAYIKTVIFYFKSGYFIYFGFF